MTFNSPPPFDESPIMSLGDFNTAIAPTCGARECEPVRQAREAIILLTDPSALLDFQEQTELPNFLKEAAAEGMVGTIGEDGRPEELTPKQLTEFEELRRKALLERVAQIARMASFLAGTRGSICQSGPQTYTRDDGGAKLTLCGAEEEIAAHSSQCKDPICRHEPVVAEIRVTIQPPQQSQTPPKRSSSLFRRRGESQ